MPELLLFNILSLLKGKNLIFKKNFHENSVFVLICEFKSQEYYLTKSLISIEDKTVGKLLQNFTHENNRKLTVKLTTQTSIVIQERTSYRTSSQLNQNEEIFKYIPEMLLSAFLCLHSLVSYKIQLLQIFVSVCVEECSFCL